MKSPAGNPRAHRFLAFFSIVSRRRWSVSEWITTVESVRASTISSR